MSEVLLNVRLANLGHTFMFHVGKVQGCSDPKFGLRASTNGHIGRGEDYQGGKAESFA